MYFLEVNVAILGFCMCCCYGDLDWNRRDGDGVDIDVDRRNEEPDPGTFVIGDVNESMCVADIEMRLKIAGHSVTCGDVLPFNLVKSSEDVPVLGFNRAKPNRLYTLMMVDPDAPVQQAHSRRSWIHWLILNIKNADIDTGEEVLAYAPPSPPPGTGAHRYVFLLLQQNGRIDDSLEIPNRGEFYVNDFVEEHSLTDLRGFTLFSTENEL